MIANGETGWKAPWKSPFAEIGALLHEHFPVTSINLAETESSSSLSAKDAILGEVTEIYL